MGMFFRRAATVVAALGLMAGSAIGFAGTASAAEGDASCKIGEVCFYYYQNLGGCTATFYNDNARHANYNFAGSDWCRKQPLNNNAGSAMNRARFSNVYIYDYSNYGGAVVMLQNAGGWSNLGALRNKNGSHWFSVA